MSDAQFEDGSDAPLRLVAISAEDLRVIAALVQDGIFPASEIRWDPRARRLALLVNRFRWEDERNAKLGKRAVERVQSLLVLDDVTAVASQGVEKGDPETILSLLEVSFQEGKDGTGHIVLTLAGDGAIRASVECVNVVLQDVTRPYLAPSGKVPHHPD